VSPDGTHELFHPPTRLGPEGTVEAEGALLAQPERATKSGRTAREMRFERVGIRMPKS
jgi:hypothetical protein